MPTHAQLQRPAPAVAPGDTAGQAASRAGSARLSALAAALNARPQSPALVAQRRPNQTGLPDNLKTGVEQLSGRSLDAVRVHFNSAQPARLQAHALAQGPDIHLGPGQERHLPHEAWHVVQQMQCRVPATLQMHGVPINDDPGLEHEADVMGGRAIQMRVASTRPLRAGLLTRTALAPAQLAFWDYVPSWQTLAKTVGVGAAVVGGVTALGLGATAAVGLGVLGGAATALGGIGAGVGAGLLGAASVATGGLLPALAGPAIGGLLGLAGGKKGALAGALLGGVAGPALAAGALGAAFGGTIGADVQSKLTPHPKQVTNNAIPAIGNVVWARALEKTKKNHGNNPTALQVTDSFDDSGLWGYVRGQLRDNHQGASENVRRAAAAGYIDAYYSQHNMQRIAAPNAPAVAPPPSPAIRTALLQDNYVNSILDGTAFANQNQNPAPTLQVTGNAPQVVTTAKDKFNALVDRPPSPPTAQNIARDALPNVGPVESGLTSPISAMWDSGKLTAGWGSPADVVVHELGHHLENNLEPSEFGTMHNFLRARSMSPNFRRVGYAHLLNEKNEGQGYDTNMVNPRVGNYSTLTGLGANLLRWGAGSKTGEKGIDKFIQHNAHTPESSYATKVYGGGDFRTEFLATTIHFLADPSHARTLITDDPLRVCLFLYLAQRAVYDRIKHVLAGQQIDLDAQIHRLHR